MADYVRGRFHAARVGVTMALLGLLAGLGIKSQAEQPPTTVAFDPAATKSIAKNVIGSVQIKNHSLLYKDLKLHQVPSYKEFKSFSSTIKQQFLKLNDAFIKLDSANLLHKIDSYLKLDVYNKAESDGAFLKIDGTASNALKLDGLGTDQIVQGHGQVMTGNLTLGSSDGTLFILIGLLRATAKETVGGPSGADVTLENLSTTDTLIVNGDGQSAITIKPGGSAPLSSALADGSVRTLQVVVQGGTQAITLSLSSFTGGVHQLVGQALIGSY
jgi:hypothetical protein